MNKKVSGWELGPCNNTTHEASGATPSVSILLLPSVVRRKRASLQSDTFCLHSLWEGVVKHQHVACRLGLHRPLARSDKYKKHREQIQCDLFIAFSIFVSAQMHLHAADGMRAMRLTVSQVLILRVYLSHTVMLRSHDHMNHQQQLRLINHSFTGREGGTECAKRNQESSERERQRHEFLHPYSILFFFKHNCVVFKSCSINWFQLGSLTAADRDTKTDGSRLCDCDPTVAGLFTVEGCRLLSAHMLQHMHFYQDRGHNIGSSPGRSWWLVFTALVALSRSCLQFPSRFLEVELHRACVSSIRMCAPRFARNFIIKAD